MPKRCAGMAEVCATATNREQKPENRAARRRAQRELRKAQSAEGLKPHARPQQANGTCSWQTVKEEQQARQSSVEAQLKVFHALLPTLLKRLARIPDPRNPA